MMLQPKTRKGKMYEIRAADGRVIERTNIRKDAIKIADTHGLEVYDRDTDELVHRGQHPNAVSPPTGSLTESQIAELWGCVSRTVEYRMRKLRIDPIDGVFCGSKRERAWIVQDVERAAALWAERTGGQPGTGEKLAEMVQPAADMTEIQGREESVAEVVERIAAQEIAAMPITDRRLDSPELLELIADRVDRMQIDLSRLGAGLARLDAAPDPDELARLRRPVSAAALARIVATLGDVDVDAAGPWLVLRRPGRAEGVAA